MWSLVPITPKPGGFLSEPYSILYSAREQYTNENMKRSKWFLSCRYGYYLISPLLRERGIRKHELPCLKQRFPKFLQDLGLCYTPPL